MPGKRYTAEQIITQLREDGIEPANGRNTGQVRRRPRMGQTCYRRFREYVGLRVDQAKKRGFWTGLPGAGQPTPRSPAKLRRVCLLSPARRIRERRERRQIPGDSRQGLIGLLR